MKILLVSMNNHHFKRWAEQVSGSGHELYWFDVLDQGAAPSLSFMNQITDWKKGFFKKRGRSFLKKNIPVVFKFLEHCFDFNVETAFQKTLHEVQPDIVHCFEMKISGLKILSVMQNNKLPLIYSSWGTDLFDLNVLGISREQAKEFLDRVDYLITDCKRDALLAKKLGFKKEHLGVFPGNGGVDILAGNRLPVEQRNYILIKGYESEIGKALPVVKAIEMLPLELVKSYNILIYSADLVVMDYVNNSDYYKNINVELEPRYSNIPNEKLLNYMGKAVIHIANSKSDGMPNALLEAMSMGAFPIQSNPGGVSEEVISNGVNGFLIEDVQNSLNIAGLIEKCLSNNKLVSQAQKYNVQFIDINYNRSKLQPKIAQLYHKVFDQIK